MKLINLVRHDFYNGILKYWYRYLFEVAIIFVICGQFHQLVEAGRMAGEITSSETFLDYMIYLFRGQEIYIPNSQEIFELPIFWLILQFYLASIIGNYFVVDISAYGQQILIRSVKRINWFISKCIWNLMTVTLFYLVIFLSVWIFNILFSSGSLGPIVEIGLKYSNVDASEITGSLLPVWLILLPFLTSFALSILQMIGSYLLNSGYSYILIVSIYIISLYYTSPYLIGNYAMLLRTHWLTPEGVSPAVGAFIEVAVIVIFILLGAKSFNRYDIIKKKT